MEKHSLCPLLDRIEKGYKPNSDQMEALSKITKQTISFLIKNGIPITPTNYRNWFHLFCSIKDKDKQPSDTELFSRYKKIFHSRTKENLPEQDEEIKKRLKEIAKEIEDILQQSIQTLYTKNHSIQKHTKNLEESEPKVDGTILHYLKKILSEVEELKKENVKLQKQLQKYYQQINSLRQELLVTKAQAELDPLTELLNRRRFEAHFAKLLEKLQKDGQIFSLIMLDIDDFKDINDSHGHLVGDDVLIALSNILKTFINNNHISARIGGEEFAILLPDTTLEEAAKVAEKLRNSVMNRTIGLEDGKLNFTVSIGVTQVKEGDTMQSMIKRADDALYEAKRLGKNRVVVA